MSNNISEQIFEAIDVITNTKLSKLKYDKTVQAIVHEVLDLDAGVYRTRYSGNIFTAYARDVSRQYKVGDEVYVKIPEGDFSNRKIITGYVSEQSLSEAQLNQMSNAVIAASPDFDSFYTYAAEPWKVCAGAKVNEAHYVDYIYGSETKAYSYDNLMAQYASQYEHFQIKANFRAAFNSSHSEGNYGIEICFFIGDQPGEEIKYRLDLGSFNGDPYHLSQYSPQSVIFTAEKGRLKGLKYIKVFQENFDYDYVVNYAEGKSTKVTSPNIFVKDLDIGFVEIKDLASEAYYCYIATPYGAVLNNDIQNIELRARFVSQGRELSGSKLNFKWFERDLSVMPGQSLYDKQAGYGWKPLNKADNLVRLGMADVVHQKEYKVVAAYDKVVMTAEKEVLKGNSAYDYNIRQVTDGNDIKLQLENNKRNGTLLGDWYVSYPDGTFAKVTSSKSNSVSLGNHLIYGSAVFYCAVYDYTNTYIVGNTSYSMKKSESEEDIIVTYVGEDTFSYDANGDMPVDNYGQEKILQVQLAWREGKGASDYGVEWLGPDGAAIPTSKTANYSPANSMMANIWIDTEEKLHYNIRNKFDYTKNDNTFTVIIKLNSGQRYSFKKEIIFMKDGDQGTNGTSYVAVVRPCDASGNKISGFKALRYNNNWDNSNPLKLRCYVYKDGELLNGISSYNIEYAWNKSVGVSLTPGNTDTAICYGSGTITSSSTSKELERYAKVEVKLTDVTRRITIYVFYPIDVIVGNLTESAVDASKLPISIKYTSAGEQPEFSNQASIGISYNGVEYTSSIVSLTPSLVDITKLGNVYKLAASPTYLAESIRNESTNGILKCPIGSNYILHSIILYLDTYGNTVINGWDGKQLEIDSNGNYILAPQIGAGEKDSANRFTGVVMGKKDVANGYANGMVGLYGFSAGQEAFAFKQDGTAFIGKATEGRIEFNGTQGTITSYAYTNSGGTEGMAINLRTGRIDAYNFKLSSANMTLESSGSDNLGKFLFKLGNSGSYFKIQDTCGANLLNISKSGSTDTYILQSSDYNTTNQTGMQINLGTGRITSYNFALITSNLQINSNAATNQGTFLFKIGDSGSSFRIQDSSGTNLLNIARSGSTYTYMLQAANFSTTNQTGTQINLSTGAITSYNFALRTPYLTINSNSGKGTFDFDVSGGGYFRIKGLNKTLMQVGDNSYYLQSSNYAYTSSSAITGFYLNLNTGVFRAGGSAEFSGTISASGGSIGGWSITQYGLSCQNGTVYLNSTGYAKIGGLTVSNSGTSISGTVTASAGSIGGWSISQYGLSCQDESVYLNSSGYAQIGGLTISSSGTSIKGTVTATAGQIGNWYIMNNRLQNSTGTVYLDTSGIYGAAITTGQNFAVDSSGNLTAKDMTANNKITINGYNSAWLKCGQIYGDFSNSGGYHVTGRALRIMAEDSWGIEVGYGTSHGYIYAGAKLTIKATEVDFGSATIKGTGFVAKFG